MNRNTIDRRRFIGALGTGAAGLLVGSRPAISAQIQNSVRGKADHCIMLWLGGGCSHVDTWDPKRRGDPVKRIPGSDYRAIPTAVDGVQVCEHLPRSARLMDRISAVRTVHHDTINEHAAAVNRMHTGRPTSGTVVYPSIGSIIAHERGAAEPSWCRSSG